MRTAGFKSANALVGWLLQQTVERIDNAYQPKAGEVCKGREAITVQGIFGHFELQRAYYHHADQVQGRHPADAALGLEGSYTPALAKLMTPRNRLKRCAQVFCKHCIPSLERRFRSLERVVNGERYGVCLEWR